MEPVNALIKRLVEYITAMRIELERKKMLSANPVDTARVTELSCYMTLCGMDNAHKFLVFRNAMNANYKANNFITAAHFARLVLDLEPSGIFANKPEVVAQHKKYFQAFQSKGTNALKLKFNQNLSVEMQEVSGYLCTGSLEPLDESKARILKCPLCGSVHDSKFAGQPCFNCELCVLGEEVIGLNLVANQ
mmetsp:Transcript_33362/g.51157  ORF Transcript_33362/g.51157 Transcript_33362/m.51157 type:complete len:191 (-) Transcript_33362:46-618(-)